MTKGLLTKALLVCLAVSAQTTIAHAQTGTPDSPIRHLVVIFQENVSFDH